MSITSTYGYFLEFQQMRPIKTPQTTDAALNFSDTRIASIDHHIPTGQVTCQSEAS